MLIFLFKLYLAHCRESIQFISMAENKNSDSIKNRQKYTSIPIPIERVNFMIADIKQKG